MIVCTNNDFKTILSSSYKLCMIHSSEHTKQRLVRDSKVRYFDKGMWKFQEKYKLLFWYIPILDISKKSTPYKGP